MPSSARAGPARRATIRGRFVYTAIQHARVERATVSHARDRARSRYAAGVRLPIQPPLLPMLARRVDALPSGDGFLFEPKWDGFRVLVFRDGDELLLQSRDEKPLDRYFPDLRAPLLAALPERAVLDGEIVIARAQGLDFEALQTRIHPAASRVKKLAEELPASIVFWDLLCVGDEDLRALPFVERRRRLLSLMGDAPPPLHVTPATTDRATAEDWFTRFEGAGLDGVMAKPVTGAYESNKRAMLKVKHERTCECVVAGFRWHKNGEATAVGSLLLGLYDRAGALQHVGVTASFTEEKRRELVQTLSDYRTNALEEHPWRDGAGAEAGAGASAEAGAGADEGASGDASASAGPAQRKPGARSRWTGSKSLAWEPLRPELVVEVAYDHMQGARFRHTAQFRRWRTDKPASACTYDQLETTPPFELGEIFAKR